jgi:hypothetical protein
MVALNIGMGLGILMALQSMGFRATQGECSIPLDLANKHSVLMDTLWSAWEASSELNNESNNLGKVEKRTASRLALRSVVVKMANLARFHLHRTCDNQSDVPKKGRKDVIMMCCTPCLWEEGEDKGTMETTIICLLDPGGDNVWALSSSNSQYGPRLLKSSF